MLLKKKSSEQDKKGLSNTNLSSKPLTYSLLTVLIKATEKKKSSVFFYILGRKRNVGYVKYASYIVLLGLE